jgi:hypothetical protein
MRNVRRLPALLCVGLALHVAATAVAAPLVFFDGSPRGLYNFDTETGAVSFRAPVGGSESFRAIDRNPADGGFYAVDLGGGLWTIDLDTGATSLVGNTGLSSLVGLAIHPTSGEFFAFRRSSPGGYLYRLDPATAIATQIGFSQVDGGLAFSPDGTLYGLDDDFVHVMDTTTGTSQRVAIPSFTVPLDGTMAGDGTFTPDGRYIVNEWWGYITEADPIDSSGRRLGSSGLGGGMGGIVYVPEPSGLVLLVAGAVAFAAWKRRGRRV